MRAVVAREPGPPAVLALGDAPAPTPGPTDVLVRVRATALNRADLLQRAGQYPPPPDASPLLGLEAAGEVVGRGGEVTEWAEGDRVCVLLAGGGYAQYCVVPAAHALPVPANVSFVEAAALPEAFLTAFQALTLLADARPGETLLLHAAASGVGTAALQLARRIGLRVFATASTAKLDAVRTFGPERVIDYTAEDFAAQVLDGTDGRGADVIVDVIGAAYADAHVRCLARDGRWVVLATMGGGRIERFDLRALFAKRGTLITSTLRSRSDAYKADLVRRFRDAHWDAFADGTLAPVIDAVYDWRDVRAAHEHMEARTNVGKIVLQVD